jgi:hypothetical protein
VKCKDKSIHYQVCRYLTLDNFGYIEERKSRKRSNFTNLPYPNVTNLAYLFD